MRSKMKIGIDFHGVIDKKPQFFSEFTKLLKENGHEVHILTGSTVSNNLLIELTKYQIHYTHIFSITDYKENCGARVIYDDNGNPWIDDEDWNGAKAEYCQRLNIDIHLDDSSEYGKYFKTPYCLFSP